MSLTLIASPNAIRAQQYLQQAKAKFPNHYIEKRNGHYHVWVICPICGVGRWVAQKKISASNYTGIHKNCWVPSMDMRRQITIARIGKASGMKGKHHSEQTRLKISEGGKACERSYVKTKETKRKISNTLKKRLREHPELIEQLINLARKSPNKAERELGKVLKPFGFHFTGDGSHHIGSCAPDFWNGNHKVIEYYGDYWHRGQDPQERIDLFAQYGYKCLIIWGSETRNMENVIQRVKEFCNA